MTPVQMVQEWLTAIGETEYDQAHRERLMWEELRELQAAMDEYHAVHDAVGKLDEPPWSGDLKARAALAAIARELCDLAYVAIGTAVLMGHDWLDAYTLAEIEPPSGWQTLAFNPERCSIERNLYQLFFHPFESRPIRRAAAFYGIGGKLEACFAEVHRANMAKLLECGRCEGKGRIFGEDRAYTHECFECNGSSRRVKRTPDGKIIKPTGWQPPDLRPILFGGMEAR
jgi:predicted HAD superfamily Cof-like phosphohydrolase